MGYVFMIWNAFGDLNVYEKVDFLQMLRYINLDHLEIVYKSQRLSKTLAQKVLHRN